MAGFLFEAISGVLEGPILHEVVNGDLDIVGGNGLGQCWESGRKMFEEGRGWVECPVEKFGECGREPEGVACDQKLKPSLTWYGGWLSSW